MTLCKVEGCNKPSKYNHTKNPYCAMHLERIRRNGSPKLRKELGIRPPAKIPYGVDGLILKFGESLTDQEIVFELNKIGINNVDRHNVGYRRRKLGKRKYLRGEIKKHKAWVRAQAIKKYGEKCEICGYAMAVDTHHIIPKYNGGPHETDNLMVLCPNCHALITRGKMSLSSRADIPRLQKEMAAVIRSYYSIPYFLW